MWRVASFSLQMMNKLLYIRAISFVASRSWHLISYVTCGILFDADDDKSSLLICIHAISFVAFRSWHLISCVTCGILFDADHHQNPSLLIYMRAMSFVTCHSWHLIRDISFVTFRSWHRIREVHTSIVPQVARGVIGVSVGRDEGKFVLRNLPFSQLWEGKFVIFVLYQ